MTGPTPDDGVEDALVHAPHLDDGGFTDRVMARLPAPRPRRRLAILAPFFAAAAALGLVVVPHAVAVLLDGAPALAAVAVIALAAGAAGTALVAAAAD